MLRFDASTGGLVQSVEVESLDGETKASEVDLGLDIHWRAAGDRLPPHMKSLFHSLKRFPSNKIAYSNLKEALEEVANLCDVDLSSREDVVEYFVKRKQPKVASALKRVFQHVVRADTRLGFHLEVYKAIQDVLNEKSYPVIAAFFMVTHLLEMADGSVPTFQLYTARLSLEPDVTIRSITDITKACMLLEKVGETIGEEVEEETGIEVESAVDLTEFMRILQNYNITGTVSVIHCTGPSVRVKYQIGGATDVVVTDCMAVITKVPDVHGRIQSMTIEAKTGTCSTQVFARDFPIFVPVNCTFRLRTSDKITECPEIYGYSYFGCSIIPEGDTFSLGNLRYTSIESPGSTATGVSRAMSVENIANPKRTTVQCVLEEFQVRTKSPTDVCWMFKNKFISIPSGIVKALIAFEAFNFNAFISSLDTCDTCDTAQYKM